MNCPTCLNFTYCLSCISQQNLYKGTCYGACPVSTYAAPPICQNCPPTCLTCTSPTNCLTCTTSYSLENWQCVLNCALGISYMQVCYPCGLNCALCMNTTCVRCTPSFYLQNNVCVSQCSADKLSLDASTCVPCTDKYVNCTTCNINECLSCLDGQLNNGTCQPCVPGTYTHNSKCVDCPLPCSLCSSQVQCEFCNTGFYEYNNFCVAMCPSNMVPNGTKCDICTQHCAICNLMTLQCSICEAGMLMFEGLCYT